jgi:hypothetical protein
MRTRGRHRPWLVGAAALAAVIAYGTRGLFMGRAAPQWDAEWSFAPWFALVADMARAGRLLLWNPWSNAGSPDGAEPQSGAFSPLVVGLGAVLGGNLPAFCAYWVLTWCAAGWGMLVLARHLRTPPWGGFVAALGFASSGFFTGHAEHTPFIHAFAALPWMVWRLDCSLKGGRARPAVEAGALWGLSALAGYPGVVMLNAGLAILWALGRLLTRHPGRPAAAWPARTRSFCVSVALLLGVGTVVLSPAYLGFLVETRGYSARADALGREVSVSSNALAPGALATLTSPHLSPLQLSTRGLWPETDPSSSSVYVGALVLWLAALPVLAGPRRAERLWILGVGLLGLGTALGRAMPLRGWLYDAFWPSRYFRHSALFAGWLIFALAVLAALSARDLEAAWRRGRVAASARGLAGLACAAALSAAALVTFEAVVRAVPRPGPDLPLARIHVVASAVVILVAAAVAAVARGGWRMGLRALLVAAAIADAAVVQRLGAALIFTSDPALLETWRRAEREREHSLVVSPDRSERSTWDPVHGNKNLLTKRPVLVSYAPLRNPIHVRWAREPLLVEAATGGRRFFFASRVVETSASLAAFDLFRQRTLALGSPPLVVQRPAAMSASAWAGTIDATTTRRLQTLEAASRVRVRIRRYLPDELAFALQCPEDGWLLVTDRWAASWKATVNGVDTPIWGGDFVFRAVAVRAGLNEVSFRYRPFAFPWLLGLSWATLLAVAVNAVRASLPGGRPSRA